MFLMRNLLNPFTSPHDPREPATSERARAHPVKVESPEQIATRTQREKVAGWFCGALQKQYSLNIAIERVKHKNGIPTKTHTRQCGKVDAKRSAARASGGL